ncbi:Uncharacterized protein BP5553_09310 [Venustampulla echinocandica]|uniref:Cytochrome P450 n=1 Tax=Venustampulla echinocandica TaxID=2656787 RepID=A0A370TCD1_9HELO|nr:Uncharacterized protein BP5553_09310 [Venustampulla echinocandica]RDL31908.1 Uncharacterized protein BP5553_09310 [Venustampulla echinocandica]
MYGLVVGVASLSALTDIYGHGTPCNKDLFYSTLSGTHFNLADCVDRAEHARKRKVLSTAYALKNLESWEHKITDKVAMMIKQFDRRCTNPLKPGERPCPADLTVDYRAWTNFFTMDAIADIGLSEHLGFIVAGSDDIVGEKLNGDTYTTSYRECLHATLDAQSHLIWAYDWYKPLSKLSAMLSSQYSRWFKLAGNWDGVVYHRATKRLVRYQKGEKLDDFFQALMEDKNGKPNNLPWGEIVAEMSVMLNAGSASTAIAINNTMYLLLKHPSALATLRAELSTVLTDHDEVVAYDQVKHLPYLRACLDESMRILPPTTFGLPRRTPAEGHSINGDYIAGDTSVSISAYVAHRDEAVFIDPECFIPERWLGEQGKELQQYFIAFSAGSRGCIGRNISYLEQVILLATMLHRYEFALPHPEWVPELREHFNLVPGPLPVKVWRRENYDA